MAPAQFRHRFRIIAIIVGTILCSLIGAVLLLLAFGWPLLRGTVERRIAAAQDRPVRIGALRRIGGGLFTPVLQIDDVTIAQPAWVGRGDMLRIAHARIRLPIGPLMIGRARPEAIAIEGLRAALVTNVAGLSNWQREAGKERPSGAAPVDLGHMIVSDAEITFDDARRDRHLRARIGIDPTAFRLTGTGTIAGSPARIAVTGAGVTGQNDWPFRAVIASSVVTLRAEGRAVAPLDFGHFTAHVESTGRNLQDLDRIIAIGLFATQPYRLTATITHDRPNWRIAGLTGRIGRSDIASDLQVEKHDDRTFLTGQVRSNGFDFDDLATDQGLAEGAAKARRTGPRLFPDVRIDLSKLRRLDGSVHFDLRRLLFKTPSAVRSVSGDATLDHGVLTLSPLLASVGGGRLTGSTIIRHQTGLPQLLLDLTLRGARMEQMFTDPGIATGALAARARVHGSGETVRAAAAHFTGTVGMTGRDGAIDRRAALVAGSDIGRAITAAGGDKTAMRCLIGRFQTADGTARPKLLLLDTGVGRADGSGSVDLATERLDLSLSGHAKLGGGLKLDQPIRIRGVIKQPEIIAPPRATTAGGVLKMISRALSGKTPPTVADTNCGKLAADALR